MSDCRTTATQLFFTMFDGERLEQNIGSCRDPGSDILIPHLFLHIIKIKFKIRFKF